MQAKPNVNLKPATPTTPAVQSSTPQVSPAAQSGYQAAATQIREDEARLNAELGLKLPSGILTESIKLWQAYFEFLRSSYVKELIGKEDIPYFLKNFNEVPDSNKLDCISLLNRQMEDKLQRNQLVEAMWAQDEADREIEGVMSLLTPELQKEFDRFLETGQEVPDELVDQGIQDLNQLGQVDAVNRLQRALDKRNMITSKSIQIDRQTGQALTPEEVSARFNLDSDPETDNVDQFVPPPSSVQNQPTALQPSLSPANPVNNPMPQQNLNPVLPQTAPKPGVNRDELDPYADVGSMNSQQPTTLNSQNGRPGPRGLDDLINK
jgi:hypothetical protein